MAIQGPLAEPLFNVVDATAIAFYGNGAAAVSAMLLAPFQIFLVIYMILWGFAHWRGIIQEPVGDFLTRVMKIAFIAALALKAPIYLVATGNWVYRTPQRFLDALAPIVPNTLGNARPSNAIDIVLAQGTVASERFQSGIASTGYLDLFGKLSLFLSGLTIELFTVIMLAIMMATVLIAKVLLAVLLAVGPLFIAFLLFDSTRPMFNAWMGQILGAMFTYIIAGLVLLIGMTAIKVQLDAALVAIPPGSIASLSQFAGFFFVSVVILLVMFQVPAIGAALGNGVQVGTLGVSHTAMRAMGSASRSLSMGLKATPAAPAAAAWQRARQLATPGNRIRRR
jgi:type IV secretion system protein VirB6